MSLFPSLTSLASGLSSPFFGQCFRVSFFLSLVLPRVSLLLPLGLSCTSDSSHTWATLLTHICIHAMVVCSRSVCLCVFSSFFLVYWRCPIALTNHIASSLLGRYMPRESRFSPQLGSSRSNGTRLFASKVGSPFCLCPCFACIAGNAPPPHYGGPPPSYGSQPPPQYPPAPGPQYGAVAPGPAPYMSAPSPAPRQSYAAVGAPPQYAAPPGY